MSRYHGKHRKQSNTARNVARVAVAGAVVAAPIAVTAPANAANWDALAQCESSGNWDTNTGNGFSGGLQFTQSTWKAYGGTQYASNAKDANREEQIAVAEKVLQAQGTKAWPGCSSKLSWSGGKSDSSAKKSSAKSTAKKSAKSTTGKASSVRSQGADYTVQQGDTLGKIAQKYGVNYQHVFERNSGTLTDPNTIFPGQQLNVR